MTDSNELIEKYISGGGHRPSGNKPLGPPPPGRRPRLDPKDKVAPRKRLGPVPKGKRPRPAKRGAKRATRLVRKYSNESIEKANPNHDKLGRFSSGSGGGGRGSGARKVNPSKLPRKASSKTGPKKRAGNPNISRKPTQSGDGPYKGARMTRNTKASIETYNIKHNGVRIGGVYKTSHGTYAGSQDLHNNVHSNLRDQTKGPNIVAFKTKAQAKNFVLTNNNKGGQW